jgi:dTDP-4-dehydrorhamnose reductase
VGGALLRKLGQSAIGTYHERQRPGLVQLDVRDSSAVASLLSRLSPDLIFCPAANANVDWCERNPTAAEETNLRPLRTIAEVAPGIPIVAYSSDYVFDGRNGPYAEAGAVAPLSVYGKLKVQLEQLVLEAGGTVIRSTGIFGWEPPPAKNFVLRLVASLRSGEAATLPIDQVATPTYADDLALASIEIARMGTRGLWHVAGPDLLSRAEFGHMVARVFQLNGALLKEVTTASLAQAAPRPLRGGLLCGRYIQQVGGPPVRGTRDALTELRKLSEVTA